MVELCRDYILKLVPCGCLCKGVGREGSLSGERCSHLVCGEKSLNLSELEASEIPLLKTSVFFLFTPGSMEIL